ncbi:hypothetical protein NEOLEDRAFT_1074386 [Neolentinus lepideus HHB14362 ss-1]|uniref:Uncharacterized protein n=1 Tax=Neolentinus lepideus HHB14362 ss-1 TaxID=1314782 RepID=A0A165PG11_9AGAM|nr:hypothetical protein NEOLEDRAFT_1074386 [Neolentinus lepideus HHB14362 ss-1]
MSTLSNLVFGRTTPSLPQCDPHLMPFHISYSGPAPINSYFMVKPVLSSFGERPKDPAREIAKAEVDSAVQYETFASKDVGGLDVDRTSEVETLPTASSSSTLVSGSSSTTLVENTGQDRYVSAFRGRSVYGLKVALPEGYTGILLRTPDKSDKRKANGEVTSVSRSTRRGRDSPRSREDTDEVDEGEMSPYLDELNNRALTATHTFPFFTLWHPDIPVDEGKDEFWRSLKEWTALSHEVR